MLGRRHASCSRRLFRQAVDGAAGHAQGLAAAGGLKTLLVWAHQEQRCGHAARVRAFNADMMVTLLVIAGHAGFLE